MFVVAQSVQPQLATAVRAAARGLALCPWYHPAWVSVGTPRTPMVHWGPISGKAVGSPRDQTAQYTVQKHPKHCKDNTSKDPFSQCEQLQGIHIQVKSQYMGRLTTTELMTRMRRTTSTTTGLTWTQTWSTWTRTSTPTEDSWVPFVCLFCSVSLCRPRLIPCTSHCGSSVSSLCLIHHVSCTRWVTLSSTSPSTSFSFSSFPLSSCTFYCLSPSLR